MLSRLYPVSLVLQGKKCLVVGGGTVAFRKAEALLEAGAAVTVISPAICDELMALDDVDKIERAFAATDLEGMFLVVGATDSREVNQRVAAEAERRGMLVNIVDDPSLCNFYVNSGIDRGSLHIGISTGGASPALAKRIRQELEARYGAEYEVLTRLLREYREKVQQTVDNSSKRRAILARLADAGLETVIAESGEPAARRRIEKIIAEESANG